jgi:hypothetical protein
MSFSSLIISLFFPKHQHGYEKIKKINMYVSFMSMKIILSQIKFDIEINNDELLETI